MGRTTGIIGMGLGLGLAVTGCPEECVDADGDGFAQSERYCFYRPHLEPGDCDDGDASLDPLDRDGDRYSSCEGDCDDLDDDVHPEADDLACDGVDSDCDGEDPTAFPVRWMTPEPGAGDVHTRPMIGIEVEGRITHLTGTAVVRGDDGTSITLDGVTGGGRVVFPPVEPPLEPLTHYEVSVSLGCLDDQQWEFTTGEMGTAVDTGAFVGADYLLDLGTSNSAMPGFGGLAESFVSGTYLVLHLGEADEASGEIEAFSGVVVEDGLGYGQDLCVPTSTWGWEVPGPAEWTNPHLWADGFPLWLSVDYGGVEFRMENTPTEASATVAPDGEAVTNVWIDTVVDTRPLWPLFGDVQDDWSTCVFLTSLGVECEICPDGEPACMAATLFIEEALRVPPLTGVHPDTGAPLDTLIPVDEEDIERWTDTGFCPST